MLRHLDSANYFRDLLEVSDDHIDLACGVFCELARIWDDLCRLPIDAAPYQKPLMAFEVTKIESENGRQSVNESSENQYRRKHRIS